MEEIETICISKENETDTSLLNGGRISMDTSIAANDDDLRGDSMPRTVSAVKPRSNVLSKAEYCSLMRQTNAEQRELILEVIHRLHQVDRRPDVSGG